MAASKRVGAIAIRCSPPLLTGPESTTALGAIVGIARGVIHLAPKSRVSRLFAFAYLLLLYDAAEEHDVSLPAVLTETRAQRRRRAKRERAESGEFLPVALPDSDTGELQVVGSIATWDVEAGFKLQRQLARRKLLRRIPIVRHFVAIQPRPRAAARPRQAAPRRRRATSKLARGPGRRRRPDDPDHLGSPASQARTIGAPGFLVSIRVESSTIAFLDAANLDEARRVLVDLDGRDVLGEVIDAVLQMYAALDERCGGPS